MGAGACSRDAATGPRSAAPLQTRAGKDIAAASSHGDTAYASMEYHPAQGIKMKIGEAHSLFVPAYAICDTARSGYGPATWESACTPHKSRLTISAKTWIDSAGHPVVQFSPDVRFSPDDAKPASLAVADKYALDDPNARILYCPTGTTACVDESLTDIEVATQTDKKGSFLYRRIKHLSGYNIASGRNVPAAME
jgi:hypothetical protein